MCPGYDRKQSDVEDSVILELWGMRSTSSLPWLPGPNWTGVVAPNIYESNRIVCHLNWVRTNDLCWIELLKIELFDHFMVCERVTDV